MTQTKNLLIILIIIFCSNTVYAGAISRGYARRRREAKQRMHIQSMLSTQKISIFNTEYYAIYKYTWHWDLCPLLVKLLNETDDMDEFLEKNITETVDIFYLENMYTKSHFPLTYRDNVILTSSFVNITKYFDYHCEKFMEPTNGDPIASVIVIFGLVFLGYFFVTVM
jgi:hypothetical protein